MCMYLVIELQNTQTLKELGKDLKIHRDEWFQNETCFFLSTNGAGETGYSHAKQPS